MDYNQTWILFLIASILVCILLYGRGIIFDSAQSKINVVSFNLADAHI